MTDFSYKNKTYEVDSKGYLEDPSQWDEQFAEGMAIGAGIIHALTKEHWDVIHFIRSSFDITGRCPLVFETCMKNGLRLQELKRLFPSGYLRGACKLAGVAYNDGLNKNKESETIVRNHDLSGVHKTYTTDIQGFLIDHGNWDKSYAAYRAYELKIPGGELTDSHWRVIDYLRRFYAAKRNVPTVYETCEANNLDLQELERLFPDGYHRGAVKISGLRVR